MLSWSLGQPIFVIWFGRGALPWRIWGEMGDLLKMMSADQHSGFRLANRNLQSLKWVQTQRLESNNSLTFRYVSIIECVSFVSTAFKLFRHRRNLSENEHVLLSTTASEISLYFIPLLWCFVSFLSLFSVCLRWYLAGDPCWCLPLVPKTVNPLPQEIFLRSSVLSWKPLVIPFRVLALLLFLLHLLDIFFNKSFSLNILLKTTFVWVKINAFINSWKLNHSFWESRPFPGSSAF